MKKYLLFFVVSLYTISIYAQSNELRKISKYVIAKTEASYLYQEPKQNSPCLALVPFAEDDDGNIIGTKLDWINPNTRKKDVSLITVSVLPVVYETEDWYFVYHTVSSPQMIESKTAYVLKKDFVESPLVDISEEGLSKATGMKASIRNSGKYKGYIVLWGHDGFCNVLVLGQIIDRVAYIFGYVPYIIDNDKQVILCSDYEGSEDTLNLGKKYLSTSGIDADFKSLTDDDIDRISPYYDKSYTSMYVQVKNAHEVCFVELNGLTEVNFVIEESPEFIGGEEALFLWLKQNIKYPKQAKDNHITGRVVVSFVVDIDGTIKDVEVIGGVDPILDKEAIRVVRSMPKWKPGKQNGKPIPVRYTTPITFNIK